MQREDKEQAVKDKIQNMKTDTEKTNKKELPAYPIMVGAFMMNEYGAVTPAAYQRILMTVAELDLYERKMDVPHMIKRMGISWVLLSLAVEVKSPPRPGEMLSVSTWMSGHEGLIFRRETRICHEDGTTAAVSASFSGILDTDSRRMCRDQATLEWVRGQMLFRGEILLAAGSRFQPDKASFLPAGHVDICPSWIDELGHVNNSHYGEMAYDALPQSLHRQFCVLDRMEFYFLGELRKNERARLTYSQNLKQAEVLGQREGDGKDAFLARFLFAGDSA